MFRLRTLALAAALTGVAACDTLRPTLPESADALRMPADQANPHGPTPATISLEKIGEFAGGGPAAAEITAYEWTTRRLFVVNGALGTVDVLDLRNPAAPVKVGQISVAQFGSSANSVAAANGYIAVAIEAHVKTDPGTVAFYNPATLQVISSVTVGALPDMVVFTPFGDYVLVANEGEPNDAYTIDPEGSVSIIDVGDVRNPTVRTADFRAFNGQREQLVAQGVRIFGPGATVAQDLEPEYIAVSEDSRTAYVTLQENNALAVVDIASATVTRIIPLGYKDHRLPGNELDANDRDGINIRNWPVFGMYQPDAIAAYTVGGQTFLITANEGDARDWPGFSEERRVNHASILLDPESFPDSVCGGPCKNNNFLGRLNVTTEMGRNPATGRYERLYAFGARSFSIWRASGERVWDSGAELELRTTSLPNVEFNASHNNNILDDRSDNKGPEPEGVAIGRLGGKVYAFIGLERVGGVMVYDVTNPFAPSYVSYVNTRNGISGDLGPEGIEFVPARLSPTRRPLLIVGNEISGTTAIFQVNLH
jgi:hypothetical protein